MAKTPESPGTDELIKQLKDLLNGGQAHATFENAVKDFPEEHRSTVPTGLPYSAWQLVEHIRIAQRDILEFSSPPTGGYQPKAWPKDYWPESPKPSSAHAWEASIAAIRKDRAAFEELLSRPGVDLYKPFRWGEGQNLLREALLIADHNAYHTGEIIMIRRLLGIWHN
jgi:hypothetical protein